MGNLIVRATLKHMLPGLRLPVAVYLCGLLIALSPGCGRGSGGPSASYLASQPAPEQQQVAAEMAQAAQKLIAAVEDPQREELLLPWDEQERLNWHFVPRARKGLPLKELKEGQDAAVHALLKTGLSQRGNLDAGQIIELEIVLRRIEGREYRDPGLYFITIFGDPGEGATWAWRFEGHHLSVNFTVVNGQFVAGAPSFFGANPANHGEGRARQRILAAEEDLGRRLIQALPDEQRRVAVIAERAFGDIVTGASHEVDIGERRGLAYGRMSPEHQQQLRELVEHYARRLRPELAETDLAGIQQAGWDNVHFAWAGPQESGQGHYYRLHGPTFLVEYDNTQNQANHIHTVWRDLKNDFGRDLLREHYRLHQDDDGHGHDD